MNANTTQPRYEYSPGTGLTIQRLDGDEADCEVAGYGPGTDLADAREYVASQGGTLAVFAYPAE